MSFLRLFALCGLLFTSCGTDSKLGTSIEKKNPFQHSLDIKYSPGKSKTVLLCCHAFGGNSQSVLDRVRPYTTDTILSFNFIDHDFSHATGDDRKTVMATPLEIMPLIYLLKECVVENKMSSISLYGEVLGAANIIFAIDFLLKEESGEMEQKYGISLSDKKQILEAIRKGTIILDVPFTSIDCVIQLHGINENLIMYKERMKTYGLLNPIDTLAKMQNLNMTFIVFFDTNNQAFSTSEDSRFVKNLLDANRTGTNIVIQTDNGGFFGEHKTLWKVYSSL